VPLSESCPACDSPAKRWAVKFGPAIHAECRDCGLRFHYLPPEEVTDAA
jgi:hypothetical protein